MTECGHCGADYLRTQNTKFCTPRCRLLAKTLADANGCWVWTATRDRHGYGTFYFGGRKVGAHRAAYEIFRGPIPAGLDLDHVCRNRACVKPTHLEAVTRRENVHRGVAPTALLYRMNVCSRGHEYTPDNTYLRPANPRDRRCRTCMRAGASARKAS